MVETLPLPVEILSPYQEFLAERQEILRHKWLESEKQGKDIGYEQAMLEWVRKYRKEWKQARIAMSQKGE